MTVRVSGFDEELGDMYLSNWRLKMGMRRRGEE